jgi:hypothetical protein
MSKYKRLKLDKYIFFFKYELSQPELLHIWVRHLTTPKDALKVFFSSEDVYNKKYKRYENSNDKHSIYWNWINEKENKIIIITCFKIGRD